VQANSLCKLVLAGPLSEEALSSRSSHLREPFFLTLIEASEEFRAAIRAFVNQGSEDSPRLQAAQDAADHVLAFFEKLQTYFSVENDRVNVIDTFVSERVFEIEMRHRRDMGPQTLRALGIDAAFIFAKDDPDAFVSRLLALGRQTGCYLRLGREKTERNNIRSAVERRQEVVPTYWIPPDEAAVSWIPEDVRNTDYLFAILQNSERFRKVMMMLVESDRTIDGLSLDSSPGDFYLALIAILQNPKGRHRYGLARTMNRFVGNVLEMYVRNGGGNREQLFNRDGTLRAPGTFGWFAERLFRGDTRENWGVVFRDVLTEDDGKVPVRESFLAINTTVKKTLVHQSQFKTLWSQVNPQFGYLDGQVVDSSQEHTQIPLITQPSILNPQEVHWTEAFEKRLKAIDNTLREFQEYQNIVFEMQVAFLQRAPEQGPAIGMDDEAFAKWTREFVQHRMRNFRESSFSLGYFRTLAHLARLVHGEWHRQAPDSAERARLLQIVRVNILPPMQNVEYGSLIQRFRRLLLRGRLKVVDYDAISQIFRNIDHSDDFSYVPPEVLTPARLEALTDF
jgi:hypothetical protein